MLQYLQQKLEKEEIYVVESHLNDCPFCSDAIDGIIDLDVQQTESNLTDLKLDFEKKLKEFEEEQKKIKQAEQVKKSIPTEESNIKTLTPKRKNRQWIWAAASLFFIIGLGYSVFSFINKYSPNHKDVANKVNEKVSPSNPNYNLSPTDNTNELIHIEVAPEDLVRAQPEVTLEQKEKELNKKDIKFVPPIETKNLREEKIAVTDKKQEENYASKNIEEDKSVAPVAEYKASAEQLNNKLKESAPGISNYARDEDLVSAKDKLVKSKKSSAGLTKNATPTTVSPASNQMNYSSNSNAENYDNIAVTQNSGKENVNEKSTNSEQFTIAINNYANRNYKKAARQLEKLLPNANISDKDEIIYYLAMCNKNLHKDEVAKEYFSQLINSKKYGKLAQSAILEYSKKVYTK